MSACCVRNTPELSAFETSHVVLTVLWMDWAQLGVLFHPRETSRESWRLGRTEPTHPDSNMAPWRAWQERGAQLGCWDSRASLSTMSHGHTISSGRGGWC